jgi:hypothetical protein
MRNLSQGTSAVLVAVALLSPVFAKAADDGSLAQTLTAQVLAAPGAEGNNLAFGAVVSDSVLDAQRGGADLHINENNATATVSDNVASNLSTGNNTITESAFSNTSGIPMVVQNSGNNVIIQNSTILNLQMK